jgi:hypothetical protein
VLVILQKPTGKDGRFFAGGEVRPAKMFFFPVVIVQWRN